MYHGDIRLGDTIDIKFTTRRFTTGVPFTLAGSPVISAYVGNGTTEITAGITLTVDFDGRTGLNNVRVVATSGNGFATATNIQLVITTGTVDSISVVGEVIATFSIEARSAVMPTIATRTLDVSAAGNAGIDWSNIEAPTTPQNLSATNIDVDQVVASVAGAVASVTSGVTVTTNNDKTGYAIGVGGLGATGFAAGAIDAAALAADAGQEIADEVLNRDIAGGGSGNTRNVRNALRAIRNRVDGSTGTLTVYQEDDTTPAWTAALTRAAVNPITEINP